MEDALLTNAKLYYAAAEATPLSISASGRWSLWLWLCALLLSISAVVRRFGSRSRVVVDDSIRWRRDFTLEWNNR